MIGRRTGVSKDLTRGRVERYVPLTFGCQGPQRPLNRVL